LKRGGKLLCFPLLSRRRTTLGSLWFPQFKVDASCNDGEASEERDDHQDEDAVQNVCKHGRNGVFWHRKASGAYIFPLSSKNCAILLEVPFFEI
jgi:hypothetical protein